MVFFKRYTFWVYPILLLFSLFYPAASSAASNITVSAKQQVIISQNRGIATLPFIVENNDNAAHDFIEELSLPDGWRLLSRRAPFHLKQGERQVRLIHIVAPSRVAPGKYQISYKTTARDDPSIQAEDSIDLLIPSSSNLSIKVIEQPEAVIAGKEYEVKLQIKNKGNTSLDLKINVKDKKRYLVSNTITSLKLAPSQVEGLTLKIKTPENIKQSFFHQILLEVTAHKLQFDKLINTQIVSKIPKGSGFYKKIPAQLKLDYFDNGNYSTLQTEISSRGYIDDDDEHHIDILIRNNQTQNLSSLGSNSETRASYKGNYYNLHLGDKTYNLEGVTTPDFYGKGLEFEYHPLNKPWSLRAYTATKKDRSNESKESIRAIEFQFDAKNELTIIGNIAQQNGDDLSQIDSENTIGGKLFWTKHNFYELALSYAKDNDGQAYRIEQDGNIGSLYYDIDIQNADSKFDGKIRDRKREEATAIYRFNKDKNYLKASISQSRSNLDEDVKKIIRQQKIKRVGLGQYLTNNHRDQLYLELKQTEEKDLRNDSQLNENKKAIRLEYQVNRGNWNINAALEAITTEDAIKATQYKSTKQEVSLAYTPSENLRLGFNITDYQLSSTDSTRLDYGVNAYYQITDQQSVSGYWQHNNRDHFQLDYDYQLQNGMSLGLAASSETATNNTKRNTSYRVNFTVPFDAPLYKRKNIGSVNGIIFDKTTRKPIENVIVHIDKYYAISNKNGGYQFPSIKSGTYRISFDLSKSEFLNHLIEDSNNNEISIETNKSTQYDVSLLQGTAIEGKIIQYQPASGSILENNKSALVPSGGISGLLVTLTNLKDSGKQYKRITTQGGFFSFNGIPAGKWLVEVSDIDNLLGDLRIAEMQKSIHSVLGESLQVDFKAIPYIQKIKKIGPVGGFSISGE